MNYDSWKTTEPVDHYAEPDPRQDREDHDLEHFSAMLAYEQGMDEQRRRVLDAYIRVLLDDGRWSLDRVRATVQEVCAAIDLERRR